MSGAIHDTDDGTAAEGETSAVLPLLRARLPELLEQQRRIEQQLRIHKLRRKGR